MRQKTTSFIHVIGLGAGLSSFILILLFLQNELSYERHIPGSENMYRLVEIQSPPGIDVQHVAITSGPWATVLKENLPSIKQTLRLTNARNQLFQIDNRVLRQQNAYYAESPVLQFFNLQLISGNTEGVLDEPYTAIVSRRVAGIFYGSTDALGQTFLHGGNYYRITAVMEDQVKNSHLHFEIILSFDSYARQNPELENWGANFLATYLMLQPGSSPRDTEEAILAYMDGQMIEAGLPDAPRPDVYLQPMRDIHLRSHHIKFSIYDDQGDIVLVYIFSVVALLILVIACINYITLSTARSTRRAQEVGMRKTLGASPRGIFYQFMIESMITASFGLVLAVLLVELFLPMFNATLNTSLRIDFINNWIFNVGLLGLLFVVGLLAGAYPALVMSGFSPVTALKNQMGSRPQGGALRKVLVIVQFAIATALVMATLVFYQQWTFMRHHDLGINYDNVLNLPLMQEIIDPQLQEQLKARLLIHPGIEQVALASGANGVSGIQAHIQVAGQQEEEGLMVRFGFVDEDFFPTMEVQIIEGRNFDRDYATDMQHAVIINQAAVGALGWESPIGRQFIDQINHGTLLHVIGVIRDYNFYSLHGEIEPAVYRMDPGRNRSVLVRINPYQQQQAIGYIQKVWSTYFPGVPFEPEMAVNFIERQYRSEANAMRVITFFTILCIIISALGLYGLTAFFADQKRKEIGIRRVLGETIFSIIVRMQQVFLQLVLIALLIGLPLAWIYMSRWLDNFAFSISLGFWHLALPAMLVLLIAFLTVLGHSLKAALAQPVEAIRYE